MNEVIQLALSALAALVSGGLLFVVKSRHAAEEKYRDGVAEQFRALREKHDSLGADIQVTRGALDWLCGTLGKERPNYGNFR